MFANYELLLLDVIAIDHYSMPVDQCMLIIYSIIEDGRVSSCRGTFWNSGGWNSVSEILTIINESAFV